MLSTTWTLLICLLLQTPPQQEPEGLQASDKEVAVDAVTDDGSIERRLRQILESTGRFSNVSVDVTNGVAVLNGGVDDENERAWIAELVSNTEGIVAVSNRISVADGPVWDAAPALQEMKSLWRQLLGALPRLLFGVLVMTGVAFSAKPVSAFASRPLVRHLDSELLRTVVNKAVVILVWVVGLYLFLRVSGLTQVALTVVGGTGVLGIVLGFAFRDIAENFLASVLISIQRPFRYGDTIEVNGHMGVVQRVTPRGTILMDFEGNYIQIANAQVYKSTIKNYTANPNVRQDFTVGIGYDAGVGHAQEIVMHTVMGHSAVLQDPKPLVLVEELASATVNLKVLFWVDGKSHSKLKVRSALMRMVLRALEEEGVSMPDDSREVIFPNGVPFKMLSEDDSPSSGQSLASTDGRYKKRRKNPGADRQEESTDGEGGLESETNELNAQAMSSRSPEEGQDLMASQAAEVAKIPVDAQ